LRDYIAAKTVATAKMEKKATDPNSGITIAEE